MQCEEAILLSLKPLKVTFVMQNISTAFCMVALRFTRSSNVLETDFTCLLHYDIQFTVNIYEEWHM